MNKRSEWNDISRVNRFRRSVGMEELKFKEKLCLKCDRAFVTPHKHIHMCDFCRNSSMPYEEDSNLE